MTDEKTFGVFLHSSGNGDYVVRSMYDGWCPAPYSDQKPVHTYRAKQEKLAQKMADKLNGRHA